SRTPVPTDTGDFRLLSPRALAALAQLRERHRFMKGLFGWIGYNRVAIPYRREPRLAGRSKFNFWKLWNFALEGITSFSTAPLRLATYVGLGAALLAFLYRRHQPHGRGRGHGPLPGADRTPAFGPAQPPGARRAAGRRAGIRRSRHLVARVRFAQRDGVSERRRGWWSPARNGRIGAPPHRTRRTPCPPSSTASCAGNCRPTSCSRTSTSSRSATSHRKRRCTCCSC